jgi:hypothetical protein
LRELLYSAWDPIGVSSSFPYAVDEYDGDAPALLQALKAQTSETEIAAMLEAVQRDRMGLGPDADLAHSATSIHTALSVHRRTHVASRGSRA